MVFCFRHCAKDLMADCAEPDGISDLAANLRNSSAKKKGPKRSL